MGVDQRFQTDRDAAMQGIYRFLRSTILGGLVVLVPLIAVCAIVIWVVRIAFDAITPIFAWLPDMSVGGVSLTLLSVVVGMVVCCFLAGLLAETAIVRGLGQRAEWLAQTIPGYALMKNVGASLVGIDAKRPVRTVVVRFEASSQLGFLMDTLDDGRHVVFVPGVPRALVGTLHIVAAERTQVLDISIATALDVLGRLGVGLREKWPRDSGSVREA
jgi:uncharacterized membrane protein